MAEAPADFSEFERFVQDATGHPLPVFGRDLFLNTPADFLPATSVSPPADYTIGSGDQIKIRTWGNVNIDVQTTVDRNGQIFIPQVGTFSVAGMELRDLQSRIQSEIAKQFKSFNLSVNLGQLRSIQVFVLGEARRPGVYTISSLSTLVNALFTSGGPSKSGSMRDIEVKRENRVIIHLDVYDLLLHGDKSQDIHLLPGDIIFIPLVGSQIAIDGDVTKPGIYELRGNTSVSNVLALAGGLTPTAGTERASLDRIVDHQRVLQGFPLTGTQDLISMQGGDLLRVFPISPKIEGAVTLRGNIGAPGRYPWRAGMRVSDLIPNRHFLINRRYFNQQNALNPVPTDHPFGAKTAPNDETSETRTAAISQQTAAAVGSAPGLLTSAPQADLVTHETEINWNYAVIERLGQHDIKTNVFSFALGEAIDHPDSNANKTLEPGDVIVVYTRNEINLPSELRSRFVRIDGEVNKPGVYELEEHETLRDLVQRAGGVAPHGYPYASQLLRESVRISEDLKLRDLVAQASRDVLSPANETVSTTDGRANTSDLELRQAYVQALSHLHSSGRVNLRVSPNAVGLDAIPEFALEDGDHYFVPPRPGTVDVLGLVFNSGAQRYRQEGHVGSYLNAAGGASREGDKGREFVLRADGTVLSRQIVGRFDKLVVYPGDAVVVPARLKPGFNAYQLINLSQVVSSFALAALAIRALQ